MEYYGITNVRLSSWLPHVIVRLMLIYEVISPAFEGQGGGKCGQSTWLASAICTGGLLWRAGQDSAVTRYLRHLNCLMTN